MSVRLPRRLEELAGGWTLIGLLVALSLAYAATGGGARERQVTLLFIYVVLVVGLQIFIGNSGVFSLGHVAIAGVAAYAAAILSAAPLLKEFTIPDAPLGLAAVELPLAAAIPAAIGVGTLFALLAGLPITRLSGLAAIIVTLALLVVVRTVLTNWDALTGGAEAFYGFPTLESMWWPIGAAIVAVTAAILFRGSARGLRLQAAREDDLAAAAMGVDIVRERLVAWVVSGAVVSLGGALFTVFLGAITPQEFFIHLALLTLAMLVLGGMASVAGAVLGTAVVYIGSEVTRTIGDGPRWLGVDLPQLFGLPTLFLGAVILLVMIVRPQGLVADREVHQLVRPLLRRREREAPAAAPAPERDEPAPPRGTLAVRDVTTVFGRLRAVDGVSLDVAPGEIVGLIGPNGAGKTTLLNAITGVVPPTAGSIALDGRELAGLTPARIAHRGVARTFQNIRLFDALSVRENVAVTASVAERHRGGAPDVDAILARFGLAGVAARRARTLAYGQQRELELARAVALSPELLLLDEPSAGMNTVETDELMAAVRRVRGDIGCAVVIVDHDLRFVMSICDRVYVMNEGRLIAAGTPAEVQRDPAVVKAYLGTRAQTPARKGEAVS